MRDTIWLADGLGIEIKTAAAGEPYSYTPRGEEASCPARIDLIHADPGIEALSLTTPQGAEALIATLLRAREEVWGPLPVVHGLSQERDWVVTITEYGGHEASTGVFGPYTLAEAQDKLRELSGDPEAKDEGAYGGFDWSDESTQISVLQLDR